MKPYTVIFIGPQGSGKGTQVSILREILGQKAPEHDILNIQTGDLFRAITAKQETFAEKKIVSSLSAGVLQPDFLTYVLWGQEMIKNLDPNKHLLIDGFPRTLAQAKTLDGAFGFFERDIVHVINLDTPEEVVRKRMFERARNDDTAESIESRLEWYREETIPVINYYKEKKDVFVHNIDGTVPIEDVTTQILTALKLN